MDYAYLTWYKILCNYFIYIIPLFRTARPGMLDLKGKAKWDAWKSKEGMSQNDAKEAYIKFVDKLLEKYK